MDGDFEKTLEILRDAHREAIPEAHYAAVRARVLAQLEMERTPWWRRIWVYGFAAAALVAVIMFWPKPTSQPRLAEQTVAPVTRPQDQTPPVPAPVARVHRRGRFSSVLPVRPVVYRVVGPPVPQPLVVKLLTNDPNVVIYWFSGE